MNTWIFALLGGMGVFLIVLSFRFPQYWGASLRSRVDGDGVQVVPLGEEKVLRAMLADLSRKVAPEKQGLAERLRASGWVFSSVGEYHFRRAADAILFAIAALTVGAAASLYFHVGALIVMVLVSLGALAGFLQPDAQIRSALRVRRERLLREMGFGLERIALFLQSGAELSDALSNCAELPLFGSAATELSVAFKTRESIAEAIEKIRQELPSTAPFEEFLELVRSGQKNGQNLVEPFQTSARQMRALLQLDLIRAGNQAKTRIVLITSGVILLASLIVILAPMLLMFASSGLF